MGKGETYQIPTEAAEIYESRFVPALFGEWAPHLVDMAGVGPGQAVLDVACGTGVVARTAADRVGPSGRVVGVDLNPAMLAVARRLRADVEWRQADAAALDLPDATFDVVLCQSGLMFVPDVAGALREMARVARPDGTLGVQVWDRRESQPGYAPLIEAASRHAGPDAVGLLSTYFALGDLQMLADHFAAAGLEITGTRTREGAVRLPSLEAFVTVEVEGSPLVDRITPEVYATIRSEAVLGMGEYARSDGTASVPIWGHLVTARRAG
jgi:SAM-dependent methyltransferase